VIDFLRIFYFALAQKKYVPPSLGTFPVITPLFSVLLIEWKIVRRAALDSVLKLNPIKMMGNPVMFVVEIGSVITTVMLFRGGADFKFNLQITLWLWFTLLFANFAEAMAEGCGKAQADTLRKARSETMANLLLKDGTIEKASSSTLRSGDMVMVAKENSSPPTTRSSREGSSFR
jgi:K+-transporting ATPase ATPase B chain